MKHALATLLLLVTFATVVHAGTPVDLYNQGNKLFEQKDFAGALDAYEAAWRAGGDDPDLFLNLGNAAFRVNRVGLAIWAYSMGQRLAPRDDDLRFNLRYARAFMADETPTEDQVFVVRIARALAARCTAGEAASLALAAWLVLGGAALAWPRSRHRGRLLALLIGALLVLAIAGPLAGWQLHERYGVVRAFVTADAAVVHTAPDAEAPEAFTIHAGTELRVIDARDRFSRVALRTGLEGWLANDAFRALLP